ncbi:hypothetical protein NQZ68_025891 [Dissostichus eleginoides]|nr:hypothetical protein NQZ68_025891 [Dissostichus eleginoides]
MGEHRTCQDISEIQDVPNMDWRYVFILRVWRFGQRSCGSDRHIAASVLQYLTRF